MKRTKVTATAKAATPATVTKCGTGPPRSRGRISRPITLRPSITSRPVRRSIRIVAATLLRPSGAGVIISLTASPPMPVGMKLLKKAPIQ